MRLNSSLSDVRSETNHSQADDDVQLLNSWHPWALIPPPSTHCVKKSDLSRDDVPQGLRVKPNSLYVPN